MKKADQHIEAEVYLSGLLGPRAMRELMEQTGAGLESILFSMPAKLDRLEETIRRAKWRLDYMGNPPLILHGPYLDLNPITFDSRIREVVLERFNQTYRAAEELGAKKIVFHSGHVPTVYFIQGWAERIIGFWNDFLQDKSGILVLMENVYDKTPEPFRQVAEGVDHPDFGLCLDIGHAHCNGEVDAPAWAKALAGHVRHVHLHDNDGTADQHLALGAGTLPVEETIRLLAQTNDDLSWTIECGSREAILQSVSRLQG